jgi:hypothetical protein
MVLSFPQMAHGEEAKGQGIQPSPRPQGLWVEGLCRQELTEAGNNHFRGKVVTAGCFIRAVERAHPALHPRNLQTCLASLG